MFIIGAVLILCSTCEPDILDDILFHCQLSKYVVNLDQYSAY